MSRARDRRRVLRIAQSLAPLTPTPADDLMVTILSAIRSRPRRGEE